MMILSPELLGRLRKTTLVVKTRKRGAHKGIRRSHKYGSSLEFSDFRGYQPGDDLRQIDWNIFGRTGKHYIKRYLDEQEIKTAVYLDCTSSVTMIPTKWERVKEIAAAFAYLTLSNEDQLSFIPIASQEGRVIQRKGAIHAKSCLFEITSLLEKSSQVTFANSITNQLLKNKQLNIIITDGLEPLEKYEEVLRKFSSIKGEVWFIQCLSQIETNPDYMGDKKLIDSETLSEINISMRPKIIDEYKQKLMEHIEGLQLLCQRLGFEFLCTHDGKTIDEIILQDCYSRGWIR